MIQITLKYKIAVSLLCLLLVPFLSQAQGVKARILAQMAFMPDGSVLVTERQGRLRLINSTFSGDTLIKGLPSIRASGQGGLLDVVLHPDYPFHWNSIFSPASNQRERFYPGCFINIAWNQESIFHLKLHKNFTCIIVSMQVA